MALREIFESKITDSKIYFSDGVSVDFDEFEIIFGGVETNSYDSFLEIDGDRQGFKSFFDQCKAEGILS